MIFLRWKCQAFLHFIIMYYIKHTSTNQQMNEALLACYLQIQQKLLFFPLTFVYIFQRSCYVMVSLLVRWLGSFKMADFFQSATVIYEP